MTTFEELRNNQRVLSKDFNVADKILHNIANDGRNRLQVIVDFDRTLSKAYLEDGTMCSGSHDVLAKCSDLPDYVGNSFTVLFNRYYPVEIDPHKTLEEKLPAMVEWWTEAHDILLKSKLGRNVIRQSVAQSNITLRDKCDEFLLKLDRCSVPCLIFSAGLGDVIEEVVRQQAHLSENIHIVSNYMDFDNQGIICGFKGELIHVFNKNETAIGKSDYFETLSHRDNVILLGDSLGDIAMADGTAVLQNILKIGFLNDQNSHRKEAFLEAFDIVIDNDQSMDVPNLILDMILCEELNTNDPN